MVVVRPEEPGDIAAIHAVHAAAFPTDAEARLVDALRAAGRLPVSVVAEDGGRIIGHIAFSPVSVGGVAGGLFAPENLKIGPDGALYVCEDASVKKYDAVTGAYMGDFATGINHAADIVFDSGGNAFVSDYLGSVVKKVSADGTPLRTYPINTAPYGLHLESDAKLLVVLTVTGPQRNTIGELDLSTGEMTTQTTGLSEPFGITVGPDGRLYVANYYFALGYGGFDPDSIYVVGPNGGTAERWNTSKGDLFGAVFSTFADGDLFVNSYYNGRVARFDGQTGDFLYSFPFLGGPVDAEGILFVAGKAYAYDANATDPDLDALTYTLDAGPAGMAIDPGTGVIRWMPDLQAIGQHSITVHVTDGRGGFDTQTFTVTVSDTVQSGKIRGALFDDLNDNGSRDAAEEGVPGRTVYLDQNRNGRRDSSEPTAVSDEEGIYEFNTLPPGDYSVSLEGQRGWEQTSPIGSFAVTLSSGALISNRDFGVHQLPTAENRPPVISSDALTSATVGANYRYTPVAFDPDGDALSVDLLVGPSGMSIHRSTSGEESGGVIWTPNLTDIGTHDVIMRVRDAFGGVAIQSFEVTVSPPNFPPRHHLDGPVVGGFGLSIPLPGPSTGRRWRRSNLQFGRTPHGNGDRPRDWRNDWTPSDSQIGQQTVTVIVSDGRGGSDTQTFAVTVAALLGEIHGRVFEADGPGRSDLLGVGHGDGDNVLRYDGVTGNFIDEFVSSGSGGLAGTDVVTFGPDGNLYVSSTGNPISFLRYDGQTGAFIDTFTSFPNQGGFLGGLFDDGKFGPDGYFYVSNYSSSTILRFDGATGEFVNTFVSNVALPADLAFGPDGNLYVASIDGTVHRYDETTGASLGGINTGGRPVSLAFRPDGYLYISNYVTHSVDRYDAATGAFHDVFRFERKRRLEFCFEHRFCF